MVAKSLASLPILQEKKLWLVTGGGGFIGSHLVQCLLSHGQRVRVLDNFSTGKRENIADVREELSRVSGGRFQDNALDLVEGDVRDAAAVLEAMRGVDCVLHQAALGSVPRSFAHPVESTTVNVGGFVTVLQAAREECARGGALQGFVYASSSSVYGDHPSLPKREGEIGRPLSPYAASKRSNEIFAESFAEVLPFRLIGLRYFNVFGPRQDPHGAYAAVIPRWIHTLLRGEVPTVYGDGVTSRDFCYVENVVHANLLAAESCAGSSRSTEPRVEKHEVLNIAGGEQTSLTELHRQIVTALHDFGYECRKDLHSAPFREGDVRHSLADIGKARTSIGYNPTVPVAEGVRRTVQYFASRFNRSA